MDSILVIFATAWLKMELSRRKVRQNDIISARIELSGTKS